MAAELLTTAPGWVPAGDGADAVPGRVLAEQLPDGHGTTPELPVTAEPSAHPEQPGIGELSGPAGRAGTGAPVGSAGSPGIRALPGAAEAPAARGRRRAGGVSAESGRSADSSFSRLRRASERSLAVAGPPAGSSGTQPMDGAGGRIRPPRQAAPGPPRAVSAGQLLLLTGSQELHDELARIAAAANRELAVCSSLDEAVAVPSATLLIDVDVVRGGALAGIRRREQRVILLAGRGQPDVWQAAAEIGAHRVAVLPDAASWLVEHLRRIPAGTSAVVLGVAGGCGGAGTSTVACWLAQEAARSAPSLLLDADQGSPGLDLFLDTAHLPGLRWPDLQEVSGSIDPEQLFSALPGTGGISILSGSAGPQSALLFDQVLEAARSRPGTVVVDLGRAQPSVAERCDVVLLVVPGLRRALLASAQTAARFPGALAVVRGPLADGLDEQRAAGIVGLPLAGYLPFRRSLDRDADRVGLLPEGRRRPVRRGLQGVLAAALARTTAAA